MSKYPSKWNGGGAETECGGGSKFENSVRFREFLIKILKKYKVKTVTDLGCGDNNVLREVDFSEIDYLGYDCVPRNSFLPTEVRDIVIASYRKSDLLICRDVMIHLPNEMCESIIENARNASKLILASTFTHCNNFERMNEPSFGFAPINLVDKPFNLKLVDRAREHHVNKYIGLFEL